MAIFKCKMCGGSLDTSGGTICRCTYCGTEQTVPKLDDEARSRLYDRANYYRRNSEFDRAEAVYESIIAESPQEAEAYWGSCLCRYGIEYVRDPKAGNMVPTCHRTRFDSILDDSSYLLALKYADGAARSLYEREAAYIDSVQKRILAVSGKEEPFDVFICYKETDSSGGRSSASTEAQTLYDELTANGYKVFFSRITLKEKLGQEYEPYIFAALQSAKVMLVVGTKPDHFTSVWVKNEWSRFLSLITQGQKKFIIPCYRNMNPYDLPEELVSLQGQDLSKAGAVQELTRAVEKLIGGGTASVPQSAGANSGSLAERALLFLEDKNWQSAAEYCEKALDTDPRNAKAYFAKALAELKISSVSELTAYDKPIDNSENFEKAMRFADPELKKALQGYSDQCRINEAARKLGRCHYPSEAERIIASMEKLEGRGDSLRMAGEARRKLEELRRISVEEAEKAIASPTSGRDLTNAIRLLNEAGDVYGKDSLIERAESQLSKVYGEAVKHMEAGENGKAAEKFKWLVDYKDALPLGLRCERLAQQEDINRKNAAFEAAREREEQEAIERNRIRAELNTKLRQQKFIGSVVIGILAAISLVMIWRCVSAARSFEFVMASNYRIQMLTASPLLCFLLIHNGARNGHKGGTVNSVSALLAVFMALITCWFMHRAGGDIIYLGFTAALHAAAIFIGNLSGKKAADYYDQ